MELLDQCLPRRDTDLAERVAALEEYVEYLRQQGQYGLSQVGGRLDELEGRD